MSSDSGSEGKGFVTVQGLHVYFKTSNDVYSSNLRGKHVVKAVDDVTLEVRRSEVLSVVGESGSGKTTLGRTILGLTRPTSGKVLFDGEEIDFGNRKRLRELWRRSQMIFQDPYSTFNPLSTVHDALLTPLKKFNLIKTAQEAENRIQDVLLKVGLDAKDVINKYPNQLSGGQRQRVSIARAMLVEPKLLVADEPVSMLDVSLRAGILELLRELNRKENLTVLFITHDLAVARYISDRIAVMYRGKIVELGTSGDVVDSPLHPYTELLIGSAPRMSGSRSWSERQDTPPRTIDPARFKGCRYYPYCPLAIDMCAVEEPKLDEATPGHYVSCFVRVKPIHMEEQSSK